MNNIKYENEKIIKNDLQDIYRHFYMKFQNLIVKIELSCFTTG